ncbi:MAG: glycosyl transferase [Hyphococcus sp.]|nr:MAG: glycosyl transferase [Marinicaulis sp.]
MLSIIIPTLNAAARLPHCLEALVQPTIDGLIKEVIVVDGGSNDDSVKIADGFGAKILTAPSGRGGQLKAGAEAARGDWFLFLHGDTVLSEGWAEETVKFMAADWAIAGVFTLAFDKKGLAPWLVARGAMQRTVFSKSPYGDQGLLISKSVYEEIGGYKNIPLFEDVDIIDRLMHKKGAMALHIFKSKAVTSAERYERDGYMRRVLKNAWCLLRYRMGASPEDLARSYR